MTVSLSHVGHQQTEQDAGGPTLFKRISVFMCSRLHGAQTEWTTTQETSATEAGGQTDVMTLETQTEKKKSLLFVQVCFVLQWNNESLY